MLIKSLISMFVSVKALAGYPDSSLQFLKPTSIQWEKFQPPQTDSLEDRRDILAVLNRISKASSADCAQARLQTIPDITSVYGADLEKMGLNTQQVENINQFFIRNVWVEVDFFVHKIKETTNRLRPFQRSQIVEAHQKSCMETHPSTSYLSGHAALARAGALVLNEVFPQQSLRWNNLSKQAADNRILAGLHHPIDTGDGVKLAEEVFTQLKNNTEFQNRIKTLKGFILNSPPKNF